MSPPNTSLITNSPLEEIKTRKNPLIIAFFVFGMSILNIVCQKVAPKSQEARSKERLNFDNELYIGINI